MTKMNCTFIKWLVKFEESDDNSVLNVVRKLKAKSFEGFLFHGEDVCPTKNSNDLTDIIYGDDSRCNCWMVGGPYPTV